MSNESSIDERPRFGLIDVFAIVTAMAIAVAILKPVHETTVRTQTTSSFRPTPAEQRQIRVDWNAKRARRFLIIALPVGLALSMPLALVTQYLGRGRKMLPTRMELVGMTPGFVFLALAGTIASGSSEQYRFLLAGHLVLMFTVFLAGVWCFWFRSGNLGATAFSWSDLFGVAVLICCWTAAVLSTALR